MSIKTNPFVSARTPTILKSYFNLNNSEILREKIYYWTTYKVNSKRLIDGPLDDFFASPCEGEESFKLISPKVSLYRYFCELFSEPNYTLQTALDSYMKTLEVAGIAAEDVTRRGNYAQQRHNNGLDSSTNYARRFLEMLGNNELMTNYGMHLEILPDNYLQCPDELSRIQQTGQVNFGWIPFKISNTTVNWGYAYGQGYGYNGPCQNSPYKNMDGNYVLMTFPSAQAHARQYWAGAESGTDMQGKPRQFYSDYVFFKVKQKHACTEIDAVLANTAALSNSERSGNLGAGSSVIDIVAMLPNNYDDAKNDQMHLGSTGGRYSSWAPLNLQGGFYQCWEKRRTFVRWSWNSVVDPAESLAHIPWKFTGRYYGDFYNKQIEKGHVPRLDEFEMTTDERYLGKGKIFIDGDKLLYCPLTGYPLLTTSRVSNIQNKYLEPSRYSWY